MSEWGDLIPLALTIAFSPLPLAGLLVLLLAPEGFRRGLGFSIGWVLGVAFAATVLALVSTLLPRDRDGDITAAARVLVVLLGTLLVVSGARSWRRRAGTTESTNASANARATTSPTASPTGSSTLPPATPRWMSALDHLSPARATLIGFGYSAFRPKNIVLAAAAGVIIVRAQTQPAAIIVSVGLFTALASITMIAPVVLHAVGGEAVRDRLATLRAWLMGHLPAITSATFILLGLLLIGAGLTALLS